MPGYDQLLLKARKEVTQKRFINNNLSKAGEPLTVTCRAGCAEEDYNTARVIDEIPKTALNLSPDTTYLDVFLILKINFSPATSTRKGLTSLVKKFANLQIFHLYLVFCITATCF